MLEDSTEMFVARWRSAAAQVELFARTEGSPLLEARAGEIVLQLFERSGPYLSRPGPARVIINPTVESVELTEALPKPSLEVAGVSRIDAVGPVLELDGNHLLLDAGVPLVVGSSSPLPPGLSAGSWVRISSIAPVHAFVVTEDGRTGRRREQSADDAL